MKTLLKAGSWSRRAVRAWAMPCSPSPRTRASSLPYRLSFEKMSGAHESGRSLAYFLSYPYIRDRRAALASCLSVACLAAGIRPVADPTVLWLRFEAVRFIPAVQLVNIYCTIRCILSVCPDCGCIHLFKHCAIIESYFYRFVQTEYWRFALKFALKTILTPETAFCGNILAPEFHSDSVRPFDRTLDHTAPIKEGCFRSVRVVLAREEQRCPWG